MPKKTLSMEMGNLICRFGNKKVLLDMLNEIVVPCFNDKSLIRSYDKTSYFFDEVSTIILSKEDTENVIGIAGRYIKDTTLEREQIFERGQGLVKSSDSMRSSPSALFLLILNNHRLIYVKETKDAPSKESFRSTLLAFLRNKHKQYIESQLQQLKSENPQHSPKRITKKDLYDSTPKPTLELIPLTSEDSIDQFVRKYDILKTIEISLSDRNDENDNDLFFEELQKRKDIIDSKSSTVKHQNTKGLDKEKAITEIAGATEQGNQKIKLTGTDIDGDTLRGNNENFQLKKPLEKLDPNPAIAAKDLYKSFVGLVRDNLIRVPKTSQRAKAAIDSFTRRHFQ